MKLLVSLRHLWLPAGLFTSLSCQAPEGGGLCGADTPIQLLQLTPETTVVGWRVGNHLVFLVDDPASAGSTAISMDPCGKEKQTLATAIYAMKPIGENAVLMCDAVGTISLLDLASDDGPRALVTETDCSMYIDGPRLIAWQPLPSDPEFRTAAIIGDVFDPGAVANLDNMPPVRWPSYDRSSGLVLAIDEDQHLVSFAPESGQLTIETLSEVTSYLAPEGANYVILEYCADDECMHVALTLWDRNTGDEYNLGGYALWSTSYIWSPDRRYLVMTSAVSDMDTFLFDLVNKKTVELPPHENIYGFFADNSLWMRDRLLAHTREFSWSPTEGTRQELLVLNDQFAYYSPSLRGDHLEVIFGEDFGLLSGSLWRIDPDGSEPVEIAAEVGRGYVHLPGDQLATVLNQRFDDYDDLYGELLGDLFFVDTVNGGGIYVDSDVYPVFSGWQLDLIPDGFIYRVSDGFSERTGLWAVAQPGVPAPTP